MIFSTNGIAVNISDNCSTNFIVEVENKDRYTLILLLTGSHNRTVLSPALEVIKELEVISTVTPTSTKVHKSVATWALFEDKWQFSITLDNNNDLLYTLSHLYFTKCLNCPDWSHFYCYFSLDVFDPFDKYSAFWFPLNTVSAHFPTIWERL